MQSESPLKTLSLVIHSPFDGGRTSQHIVRHLCRAHWLLLAGVLLPFGDWKVKLAAFSVNLLGMVVINSIIYLHNSSKE